MADEITGSQQEYWQAQDLVELGLSHFRAATEAGRSDRQRSAFFRLASFHGRTLRVLNSGLHKQNEPLVQAALHNLLALHRGMVHMHRSAPQTVPLPVILSEHSRSEFERDLIMRVLAETPPALPFADIHQRTNHLNMLGQVSEDLVQQHLQTLLQAQHIEEQEAGFVRTSRPYIELNKNVAGLRALVGRTFFNRFAHAGYDSLRSVHEQAESFKTAFPELTGFHDPHTVEVFLSTVHLMLDTSVTAATVWRFNDLLHSPYPRPYQRAAFDAFQRGAFDSLVIDAPTGSGKTLIGMMCIQDWLRTLGIGQSILVLVPTSNYQQQWIEELCYNSIGLHLPPEIIFSGTPADLNRYQQLTGRHPALLLITYTALSQLGSPSGKGGFDAQSVELFLQQTNVKYVILDEVHKVAEDMHGVAADVTRLLVSWQQDTSLRSLIGVSGTAMAYRSRFEELGLSICYGVPIDDLVAAGFVAPFAELGVPFAYSGRERRIRELLDTYKEHLRSYFQLLGPGRLRHWFAQIPLEERRMLGHDILGIYRGRADWQNAIDERFREWESGPDGSMKISEARMLILLQAARGWSDRELAHEAAADMQQFDALVEEVRKLKDELGTLVYLPKTLERLHCAGFTTRMDAGRLRNLPRSGIPAGLRPEAAKDILAASLAGLYDGLSEWYLRTSEGRVATIQAVIEAEQAARDISGAIIFDSGKHIPWREGLSRPGYQGLAGLFSEMLGDQRFTIMAVLSNEIYLTCDPSDPVTLRIADFIFDELVVCEVAQAIFNLLVSGLDLPDNRSAELRALFGEHVQEFIPILKNMRAARPAALNKTILKPLRRDVKRMNLGTSGKQLLTRIDPRNVHLKRLVQTVFDYGMLAAHLREAHIAEVEQVSGARQKFFVVTMPGEARRKQLMYALTARIVDAESLPVNLIIVSNWARTGWNVIQPNLLLDATATRDVTAWQQLRGRAIRAWRTWNNDCYRLLSILSGRQLLAEADAGQDDEGPLDQTLWGLLAEITTPEQQERILTSGVSTLGNTERRQLAVNLMQQRNKVTHIYELVKASGSTSQVVFNRNEKTWQRQENIGAKHNQESSVNPFNGQKTTGDSHAPFIYAQDPRTDVPGELQQRLLQVIRGCDDVIVAGWLQKE